MSKHPTPRRCGPARARRLRAAAGARPDRLAAGRATASSRRTVAAGALARTLAQAGRRRRGDAGGARAADLRAISRRRPPTCRTRRWTRNCCSSSCCPRSPASAATCSSRRRATWSMAKTTRDPRLAQARDRDRELRAAAEYRAGVGAPVVRDWTRATRRRARRWSALLLIKQQAAGGQAAPAGACISADGNIAQGFMQLHSLLAKHPDKQGACPDGHQGAGQGLPAAARGALRRGAGRLCRRQVRRGQRRDRARRMKLRPDWELGALLQAQMLQQRDSTAEGARVSARLPRRHIRRRATCAPTTRAC